MQHEVIIIGAGASALMLGALLPKGSAVLVEGNVKAGEKIRISGGGKCNITNAVVDASYYLGDESFVTSVLTRFDANALLVWLKKRGLEPVLRKNHQYFCPKSATQLLDLLLKENRKQKQQIDYQERVVKVEKRGTFFYVKTTRRTLSAPKVVVASGGLSFPKLGATPIGYEVAQHFGHTIVPTAPALVGFTVQKEQFFFKELSGVSTEVVITVGDKQCHGSLLFAHKGISGPAVLDASLYWKKGTISVDFLPGFSLAVVAKSPKKLSTLLPMPKRVSKAFLLQLGLADKAGREYSPQEREILGTLHHYTFAPAGHFGYAKAEVTKGGVSTQEVDATTLQSKIVEGLYFTGEVLDVTGQLGGYNFQWAFSSAFVCAQHIRKGSMI